VGRALFIHAEWDTEAGVWVAMSDDVPGLVAEADTFEALSAKLDRLLPELLQANGYCGDPHVVFELLARRYAVAHLAGAP